MRKIKLELDNVKDRIKDSRVAEKLSSDYDANLSAEGIDSARLSAKRAKKAHFAGLISIALCVAILLSMALIFGKDISPMNMYYFFREVNLMGQIGEGEREQISYSQPTRNQSFSEFKRGFVVASDREVQVFNKAGYETSISQLDYSNPIVISSKNTFLVYDLGGVGFTLYNSFEDVYSESREYHISAADMADDGRFAVVGKSQRYNSELTLYDDEGKREFSYKRNDYAVACKYSENGNHIVLLTINTSLGEYIYTLTVISTRNGEVVSSVDAAGDLAYGVYYMNGDRIAVLCEGSLTVYNSKCEEISTFDYPTGELYRVSGNEKYMALLFTDDKVGMTNTLYLIDSRGALVRELAISGEFSDMVISSKYGYFATKGGVYRMDLNSGKLEFASVEGTDGKLIILDSARVMLCRTNTSYILDSWS